jgi:pimeloyl-ACP methyl ester carboxylesterase
MKATKQPIELSVKNPKTEALEKFYLSGEDFIVVFTSAGTGGIADVPFEINKLLDGDYSLIEKSLESVFSGPGSGAGMGMRLSVWCAEEQSFNDDLKIAAERKKHELLMNISPQVFEAEICNIWSVKKATERDNSPIKSDIPVLLMSGEYDNETPPKWASQMQKNLTNSFHLVFKGWAHMLTTNWSNQCAMTAANQFFNDPFKKPDALCMSKVVEAIFKTE